MALPLPGELTASQAGGRPRQETGEVPSFPATGAAGRKCCSAGFPHPVGLSGGVSGFGVGFF